MVSLRILVNPTNLEEPKYLEDLKKLVDPKDLVVPKNLVDPSRPNQAAAMDQSTNSTWFRVQEADGER